MKTKTKLGAPRTIRFELLLLSYGNTYYISKLAKLEQALARRPRELQLNLLGEGEIPADTALLLRSVLNARSPRTRLVTHARSSLQNGSVLVWLLGDRRLIRADARLFFRKPEDEESWKDRKPWDNSTNVDPEEADHLRMLRAIDEYLPVSELAGGIVEAPELRQFGLVDHEQWDRALATAFAPAPEPAPAPRSKAKRARTSGKVAKSEPAQK